MAKNGNGKTISAPVIRTSAGLREAIFDEIDGIRAGNSNPTRANAVAKLATTVVETVRMELEVQRHLRNTPAASKDAPELRAALSVPLALGSPS